MNIPQTNPRVFTRLRKWSKKTAGSALLIVIGITFMLSIITYGLFQSTISTRWLTTRSSNDQKAQDCAEAATNLVYRMLAEEMNDPKMLFDILSFKKVDTDTWFWKFRLPLPMAEASVDPLQIKSQHMAAAATNGLGMKLQLPTELAQKLKKEYSQDHLQDLQEMYKEMGGNVTIKSEAKMSEMYGILPKGATYEVPGVTVDMTETMNLSNLNISNFLNKLMDPKPLKIDLKKLLVDRLPDYGLGDLVSKATDKISFNLALEWIAIPIPIGKLVGALLKGLITRFMGDNSTLKGFLSNTLLKDIQLSIDLSQFKDAIKNKIMGCFPTGFTAGKGKVSIGITMEKVGIMEVTTTVEYQPQGAAGITIKKTLRAQRDFRVADIEPVAPDYSFFIANTNLLFEDPAENTVKPFAGNKKIEWEKGMGKLVVHNITFFDPKLFTKFKDFFSALFSGNMEKANYNFFLPGRVRVNGTEKGVIRLNLGLLDFMKDGNFENALKGCEVVALLVNKNSKHTPHNIIPSIGESLYGTGFEFIPIWGGWVTIFNMIWQIATQAIETAAATADWDSEGTEPEDLKEKGEKTKAAGEQIGALTGDVKNKTQAEIDNTAKQIKGQAENILNQVKDICGKFELKSFDWPWVGESGIWIPMPKLYNKTYLFGDFHCEFPLSFRAEGNLYKSYSRLKMPMIRVFILLNWLFSCPNVDVTLPPIPFNDVKDDEPYGFCAFPPCEDANGKADLNAMASKWDGNLKENLPDNVYSPHQYLKKASYYYATTAEFSSDIENRSISMDVEGTKRDVFVCDGVSFIEGKDGQGLFFRKDMWVMGRGIIVCTGNIHLKSIRRVDSPDGPPTILTIISRNGALINQGDITVEASLYGDRGLLNPMYGKIKIYGNLVVNQFNREDTQGEVNIHYESNRTHASVLSYFKDLGKYDPCRYHVSLSKKWRQYNFIKN